VPGIAGLSHILTGLNAYVFGGSGHVAQLLYIQIQEQGIATANLGQMLLPGNSTNESTSYSWTGSIITPASQTLLVALATYSGGGSGTVSFSLDISGLDI
jgi:hypothetical protein